MENYFTKILQPVGAYERGKIGEAPKGEIPKSLMPNIQQAAVEDCLSLMYRLTVIPRNMVVSKIHKLLVFAKQNINDLLKGIIPLIVLLIHRFAYP